MNSRLEALLTLRALAAKYGDRFQSMPNDEYRALEQALVLANLPVRHCTVARIEDEIALIESR